MKEFILFILLVSAVVARAVEPIAFAVSPDGLQEIRLTAVKNLHYSVLRHGVERIRSTPIGLTFRGRGVLGPLPRVLAVNHRMRYGRLVTPFYRKASVNLAANETEVVFDGGWKVILVARNDAVAYRFETSFSGTVEVINEYTGIFVPRGTMMSAGFDKAGRASDACVYTNAPVESLQIPQGKNIFLPCLFRYPDGVNMLVSETALRDYPGEQLARDSSNNCRFRGVFQRLPKEDGVVAGPRFRTVTSRENLIARTQGTCTFPWRVIMMADRIESLVANDAVMALADPCMIGSTDWIKPGLSAWDWWNSWNLSGVDFKTGCNTATYKYYIDFAAEYGIPYFLLDEGWEDNLDVMKVRPGVDLPEICRYAREKGVDLILWCAWPQLVGRAREVFARYAQLGIKGFKVDFFERSDQEVVRLLESLAVTAAEFHLVLNYHGVFKPAGLLRTCPNVLNVEGVLGQELNKMRLCDLPRNDCQIPFTRMAVGPLDYTPGGMRNATRDAFKISDTCPMTQGTRVHQMALMTLFEAPMQMLCDTPTLYRQNEVCTRFMASVPTVWDETIGLAGKMGEYAAIARRKSDVWYIAAITDWRARDLELKTEFLGSQRFTADVFADGVNADKDATEFVRRSETIRGNSVIQIHLAPGGGWTARLTPVNK